MRKISRETIVWKTSVEGQVKSFDIPVVGQFGEGNFSDELPILVLGGMGERLGTSQRLVSYLGKKGVATSLSFRIPFEILPPSEASLTRISIELPLVAAELLAERTGHTRINTIARSQTAAPALMSRIEQPELFDKTGLIEPFGLTNQLLGASSEERVDEFGRRAAENLKAGWLQNKSLLSVYELLVSVRTKEAREAIGTSLLAAMSIDLSGEFKEQVEAGAQLRVFASKADPVFPYDELVTTIGKENITVIQGAHASSVSKNGFQQLDAALEWIRPDTVPVKASQ